MKLKTLKDFESFPSKIELREEAIKVFMDILKHNKNPFKAFMIFFNLDGKELI